MLPLPKGIWNLWSDAISNLDSDAHLLRRQAVLRHQLAANAALPCGSLANAKSPPSSDRSRDWRIQQKANRKDNKIFVASPLFLHWATIIDTLRIPFGSFMVNCGAHAACPGTRFSHVCSLRKDRMFLHAFHAVSHIMSFMIFHEFSCSLYLLPHKSSPTCEAVATDMPAPLRASTSQWPCEERHV